MPETRRRANALKSKVRSRVEHVFAAQKDKMDLFVRTIGIARATMKIGITNIVYNMKRVVFLDPPRRRLSPRQDRRRFSPRKKTTSVDAKIETWRISPSSRGQPQSENRVDRTLQVVE